MVGRLVLTEGVPQAGSRYPTEVFIGGVVVGLVAPVRHVNKKNFYNCYFCYHGNLDRI